MIDSLFVHSLGWFCSIVLRHIIESPALFKPVTIHLVDGGSILSRFDSIANSRQLYVSFVYRSFCVGVLRVHEYIYNIFGSFQEFLSV